MMHAPPDLDATVGLVLLVAGWWLLVRSWSREQ